MQSCRIILFFGVLITLQWAKSLSPVPPTPPPVQVQQQKALAQPAAAAMTPTPTPCISQNFYCESYSLSSEKNRKCKPEIWQKDCCTPVESQLNNWLVSGALSARSRKEALFALSKMGCGRESPRNLLQKGGRPELSWSFNQQFNPHVGCDSTERHRRQFSLELKCN
jgi:hypothetical protein